MLREYDLEEDSNIYAEGDWIVHSNYGVGQIKGIEVKRISNEATRYCRIQTTNSTFWIPVDKLESELLRPLSSPEVIQQAIAALQRPPNETSSDYKTRLSRIRYVRIRNMPEEVARLIRDLRARERDKGILNTTERTAFRSFKQQLVEEWAIVTGSEIARIASELEILINTHHLSPDQ